MTIENPLISIVIPVHNAERTLHPCLESILKLAETHREVIVVDDCSEDRSVAICGGYPVDLYINPQRLGAARSRLRGIELAKGEIIAFTDSDCLVPVDWLDTIRASLSDDIDGVWGPYEVVAWQNWLGRFATYDWLNYWYQRLPDHTDVINTGNSAFKKHALVDRFKIEVGFFDKMAAAEDTLMGMSLVAKHKIVRNPKLSVGHIYRDSLRGFVKLHLTRGYSRSILSIIFFKEKVLKSKDVSLPFLMGQMLTTTALIAAGIWWALGGGPLFLLASVLAFTCTQVRALAYMYRRESSLIFVAFSGFMTVIRNVSWMAGALSGVTASIRHYRTWRGHYAEWQKNKLTP